jgi:hypothetical protein
MAEWIGDPRDVEFEGRLAEASARLIAAWNRRAYGEQCRAQGPEGFVLVPREPTPDMIDRGSRKFAREVYGFGHAERSQNYTSPDFQAEHRKLAEIAYRAMLAAATPTPGGTP